MNKILNIGEGTLKWLGSRRLIDWIPDKAYVKMLYFFCEGKKIDLQYPKTLNEKLQWLKLYERNPMLTDMVDKYKVKAIVERELGTDYIIKTLGVWDDAREIDYDSLPNKFVLKTNHDSHSLIICKDKSSLSRKEVEQKLNKSLKRNGFWYGREWPYKNVCPKIIAEEFIENRDGTPLVDYKFYCYGGRPRYFMCSYGEAEHNVLNHKFDMSLKSIDHLFKNKPAISESEVKIPENIQEMIDIVKKLCIGYKHIRVDLYNVDGKILFGEFTFYSSAGFMHIEAKEFSDYLASLIEI
ncbi:MAG: ATP-grasp fold amidoligase family protein [Sedimentibacter saalensis]|uniref:ATP-grasp fold amidoligase family protein n=1 Tax=Sedimentibacter saalensis TaxID=130788 RepID=UPI002B1F85B6|nr:ATP-grasp fold amidoligase family protein [Sedimentibacter saalensis]MEA5093491.1 ATP-grasp fold amidoligase family protein [Sedimentibacter saalensis]